MAEQAVNLQRRRFLVRATTVISGIGLIGAATPFIKSMMPSAAVISAGAPVDVDVGKIEPGALITLAWRGKPVWVLHRTSEMLALLGNHDDLLVDPQSVQKQQPDYCRNPTRSIRPTYFVAIGICTHLGCSPTLRENAGDPELGANWPGGWFCACHGSKFDLAGRVFKNVPAPSNLVVPQHRYLAVTQLQIGDQSL